MALSIKHPDADRLARELSAATGETMTEAIVVSLRERLERVRHSRPAPRKPSELFDEARRRLARLPVLDPRSGDEILGYDDAGLPH
jgi:antitoxin VapB